MRVTMLSVRKSRKLFRRDSTVHMHPRKTGSDFCRRMKKMREKSRPFHVKYIGCTLIVSPTLPPEKASEVAKSIIKRGPRKNKRRVSFIITPEEIFVNDTISRSCLTSFLMGEIGMVYAPEGSKLFGVTVKDCTTSGYVFLLYKCTVKYFGCKNVEIMEEYERMYEEYLKIEEEVAHMTEPTPDVNVDIQSPHFRDCTCSKAMQNRERNAVEASEEETEYKDEPQTSADICKFHEEQVRLKESRRCEMLLQLMECAPSTDQEPQMCDEKSVSVSAGATLELEPPTLGSTDALISHCSKSPSPDLFPTGRAPLALLPTLKLPFPPTATVTGCKSSMASVMFCYTNFAMKLLVTSGHRFSLSGIRLRFSPCSLILLPHHSSPLPTNDSTTSTSVTTCPLMDTVSAATTDTTTFPSFTGLFSPSFPFVPSPTSIYYFPAFAAEPITSDAAIQPFTSDPHFTTSATITPPTNSASAQLTDSATSTTSTISSVVTTSVPPTNSAKLSVAHPDATTPLPSNLSGTFTAPFTNTITPVTSSNTTTTVTVSSLADSLSFPPSVSLTATLPSVGPGFNREATNSPLYDSVSPELEYSFSELLDPLPPPPFPSPCTVSSLSSSSRSLDPLLQVQSAPLVRKVAEQRPTPQSHSLPGMPPSQPWPSPLLRNVLSSVFIFTRGPHSPAPVVPGDRGLVSGESVWTSARLTSSHIHLSSSSETEDEEESDEMREVERYEEKECGTLEISDRNDDAEGEEMKGDGKDHHIDFSSSSVGEDKEITEGIETQERESALGQVCDIEDECWGDNDAKTEEESDDDDNEEDDREREDPDDYTESSSSDEADCEDSDAESDEGDSTLPQDPIFSHVWPSPNSQPTRRGFTYLSSPSLSAPGSLGRHSAPPTLTPPPTKPMGLVRSWNSRPSPPRRRVTPYILDLVKQIEASMAEPLKISLKTPEDDGQTAWRSSETCVCTQEHLRVAFTKYS